MPWGSDEEDDHYLTGQPSPTTPVVVVLLGVIALLYFLATNV